MNGRRGGRGLLGRGFQGAGLGGQGGGLMGRGRFQGGGLGQGGGLLGRGRRFQGAAGQGGEFDPNAEQDPRWRRQFLELRAKRLEALLEDIRNEIEALDQAPEDAESEAQGQAEDAEIIHKKVTDKAQKKAD